MNQLPSGVINTKSSGMVLDSFEFTISKKTQLFNELNGDRFRKVTESEFLAIQECFYALEQGLLISTMNTSLFSGCCDASTPWKYAGLGAVLFGDGQSWEIDDEAYIMQSKNKFYITYLGEIAFSQYEKKASAELAKLYGDLV